MRINKKFKKNLHIMLSVFLAVCMLSTSFTGTVFAGEKEVLGDGVIAEIAQVPEAQGTTTGSAITIASWVFSDEGDKDTFIATDGIYRQASIFRAEGGPTFEEVDNTTKALKYQGWDNGTMKKYWLATVSTKGLKNITLSSEQTSSGSGPRDFKVQISSDGQQTWTDVDNSIIKVPGVKEYGPTSTLNNLPLSDAAKDKEQLSIRWVVTSTEATKPSNPAVGSSGTGYIKNVIVKGEQIEGSDISIPTVGLVRSPKPGASDVEADAALTVKFSKPITLNKEYSATVVENGVTTLGGITVEANSDTLTINHPDFAYEKIYKVTIPKELVKGTDEVGLGNDIFWSFSTKENPAKPKLINMTFNGDPKTSRAFAWYTDEGEEGSQIQVVETSKIANGIFPEEEAMTFNGTTETVDVFMSTDDRDEQEYTKYASHKVIADKLTPNTSYSYRVGSGEPTVWSKTGSFVTDASEKQDFHFAVGSDSHAESPEVAKYWKDTLRKAIDKVNPKFFILTGDLVSYGDQEPEWQSLLGVPEDELANCPIVPILGGHEVHDYDEDENTDTDNFYYHFNLPESANIGGRTQKGSVYAFEYGDALFMQFNSQFAGELNDNGEIEYDDPEFYAQLDWMKNQVAKSDAKWKFVSFHKGAYSVGDNGTLWEANRMKFYRKYLIPVFDELGVDMVFVGHDHMYMRSYQMLNDTPLKDYNKHEVTDPQGTVYMMTNSVGSKFYDRTTEDEDGNPIPPEKLPVDYWSWIDEQPGKKMFVDVSVKSDELKVTSYTAKIGEDLAVYDHYTINRNDTKPEMVQAAKVEQSGAKAVLSWKSPSGTTEPVRGFRLYEKNDKVKSNWSVYIPAVKDQTDYSYTVDNIISGKKYDFIIKAVGVRNNSDPVSVELNAGLVPGDKEPVKVFPQHTAYTSGTIKPSHVTQDQMDKTVSKLYDEWKSKYLKLNPYNSDQYYVWYSDGDWFTDNEITVSEAHGYGMMILALMAGHDPEAKVCFDGMYRYFRAHPSKMNEDLMAWQQADKNRKIVDINGVDSATDGDMDIAYALLLADKQWGSNGDINYLAEAKKVINAIMESDVNKSEWILKLGDWASDDSPSTRPSDFMLQHLKAFEKATGDSNWNKVIDNTYGIIQSIFKEYSPNTGLLPDFVIKKDGKFMPTPPEFLESDNDGFYYYNSCRTPWRIATDYLMTGDTRAKTQLDKLNEWIRTKTGNEPENITAGYKLDGTSIEDYEDLSFSAPFMVSAMINKDNQQWLNDLWDYNMKVSTEDDLYFGNCIRLLSTIVVTGNWWSPSSSETKPENPDNSGGNTSVTAPAPVSVSQNIITATAKLDNSGVAIAEIDSSYIESAFKNAKEDKAGIKAIEIKMPKLEGANAYECAIPLNSLASLNTKNQIILKTDIATAVLPDNMLSGIADAGGKTAGITIGKGDKSALPGDVTKAIGERPLVQLTMNVDGKKMDWKNESAAVKVSIPYIPTAEEQRDTEHIVIWYIDGSGKIVSVPNGRYDPATGSVTFITTHFSYYSIAYVHRTFTDLSSAEWAKNQIEVLASRGIVSGVSNDLFGPADSITRGDFVASLIKTLGLSTEFAGNFDDVKQGTNYYEIGVAKKLGITAGTGDNKFSPDAPISRQDMIVLTAKALEKMKNLKVVGTSSVLDRFSDIEDVSKYALNSVKTLVQEGLIAGSGNKINPRTKTTRAEAAVMLYKIFSKYAF